METLTGGQGDVGAALAGGSLRAWAVDRGVQRGVDGFDGRIIALVDVTRPAESGDLVLVLDAGVPGGAVIAYYVEPYVISQGPDGAVVHTIPFPGGAQVVGPVVSRISGRRPPD